MFNLCRDIALMLLNLLFNSTSREILWSSQFNPITVDKINHHNLQCLYAELLKIIYSLKEQIKLHLLRKAMHAYYHNIFFFCRISDESQGVSKDYGRVWELLSSSFKRFSIQPFFLCWVIFVWFPFSFPTTDFMRHLTVV